MDVAKVVNYLVSNQQYVNSRATRVKSKAAPGKSKEDWASTNIRIWVYCARYLTPAALELLENDFQSLEEGQDSIFTQDFMYNKAKVCSTQHTADFQVGLMKRYQRLKTAGKRAVYPEKYPNYEDWVKRQNKVCASIESNLEKKVAPIWPESQWTAGFKKSVERFYQTSVEADDDDFTWYATNTNIAEQPPCLLREIDWNWPVGRPKKFRDLLLEKLRPHNPAARSQAGSIKGAGP